MATWAIVLIILIAYPLAFYLIKFLSGAYRDSVKNIFSLIKLMFVSPRDFINRVKLNKANKKLTKYAKEFAEKKMLNATFTDPAFINSTKRNVLVEKQNKLKNKISNKK